jgi:hypothetical protein
MVEIIAASLRHCMLEASQVPPFVNPSATLQPVSHSLNVRHSHYLVGTYSLVAGAEKPGGTCGTCRLACGVLEASSFDTAMLYRSAKNVVSFH